MTCRVRIYPVFNSVNLVSNDPAMQGLVRLSDPAVKYRLDQAVPFLKALLQQQLAERAGSRAIRWPGRSLRVVDGTHICSGAQ